ncbi:putative unclassified retrotransposon protein [Mycobacterium sp. PO1]|nr:putative unclassified retrotransposon protein [Mycobacterium sp. PO1]
MPIAPITPDSIGMNRTVAATPSEPSEVNPATTLEIRSTPSSPSKSVVADAAATRSPALRTTGASFDETAAA